MLVVMSLKMIFKIFGKDFSDIKKAFKTDFVTRTTVFTAGD